MKENIFFSDIEIEVNNKPENEIIKVKCPRCNRQFETRNKESIKNHIIKCKKEMKKNIERFAFYGYERDDSYPAEN